MKQYQKVPEKLERYITGKRGSYLHADKGTNVWDVPDLAEKTEAIVYETRDQGGIKKLLVFPCLDDIDAPALVYQVVMDDTDSVVLRPVRKKDVLETLYRQVKGQMLTGFKAAETPPELLGQLAAESQDL
ncbi:MAG: hypothetical protein HYX24_05395 [Candidatus Aenigmarchaeota archaeon]|nr:hypothetical protein [Candidatus Aenigmarchaeota archaeon]